MGKAILSCRQLTATTTSTTAYTYLATAIDLSAWTTTEIERQIKYRTAGTMSKLYVVVSANSTTGGTNTVTVRKNAGATAMTLNIPTGTTGAFEDATNSISVAAGDNIAVEVITGSGGTMTFRVISVIFDASANTVTVLCSKITTAVTASVTRYLPVGGLLASTSIHTTEAPAQYTARAAGILRSFGILTFANARTTDTVFTSRKNAGAGALAITVKPTDDDVLLEDTVNIDTLAVGDETNIVYTVGTGAGTLAMNAVKTEFETTSGAFLLMAGVNTAATTNFATTHYNTIAGALSAAVTTEVNNQTKTRMPTKFSNLATYVSANTINTGTSTVNLRVNGVDSGVSLAIGAGATGYFEDLANTISTDADDEVTTSWIKSGASGSMSIIFIACIGEEITETAKTSISLNPAKVGTPGAPLAVLSTHGTTKPIF